MTPPGQASQGILGSEFNQAFPECHGWLSLYVWKWNECEHSEMWDAFFDFQIIRELLTAGVQLPWTVEHCDKELAQLYPIVNEVNRLAIQKGIEDASFENFKAKILTLAGRVACIEAIWDGDSNGWFIVMSVVTENDSTFAEHELGRISHGSDVRLFTGKVPPWPEALQAIDVGTQLADHFGCEFYFPSPNEPDESCFSWLQSKFKS